MIEKDGFPSQICGDCNKQLCLAYKFRCLCENSFKIMLEFANFVKKSEVKLEKDEFLNAFESNVDRMESNERDVKDEKDCIKGEEDFQDLYDDTESPISEDYVLASPSQIESKNTIKTLDSRRKSNGYKLTVINLL